MNSVQQAIMDRRSTRGFDGSPITRDELQYLIDAALQSPSAMNKQPWHFAFVTSKEIMKEMSDVTRDKMLREAPEPMRSRFAAPDFDLFFGAPLFVVISAPESLDSPFKGVDCGIAVENLALSAMGLNLGSVIVGMPRDVFMSDKGAYFKKKMGVPEGNEFVIGIVIGRATVTKDKHPILADKYCVVK